MGNNTLNFSTSYEEIPVNVYALKVFKDGEFVGFLRCIKGAFGIKRNYSFVEDVKEASLFRGPSANDAGLVFLGQNKGDGYTITCATYLRREITTRTYEYRGEENFLGE